VRTQAVAEKLKFNEGVFTGIQVALSAVANFTFDDRFLLSLIHLIGAFQKQSFHSIDDLLTYLPNGGANAGGAAKRNRYELRS
jgi:hypothetical protein